MNARIVVAGVALLCALLAPVPALAQSAEGGGTARVPLTAGASVSAVSAYVWRGFTLVDEPSYQPTAWAAMGNLTVSSWFSLSAPAEAQGSVDEHDLSIDYTRSVGAVRLSVGYINYFFPTAETGRFSDEFYAGIARPGLLNPFVKVFADVHQGSGTYVSGGVSHSVAVASVSLTPTLALGYNHQQWVEGSGFSDLNVGVQAAWTSPGGRLAVAPFVNYSRSFNAEWFPSKAYGGVTVTVK